MQKHLLLSDPDTGMYEIDKLLKENPKLAFYTNFDLDTKTYGPYVACDIIDIPGQYNGHNTAFAFQKGSPYRNLFSYHLKYMEEKGITQQIIEKYEPSSQVCEDLSGKPLGLPSSFTGFFLIVGGWIVALAMLVIEKILSRMDIDISKFYEKVPHVPGLLCYNCKNIIPPLNKCQS